MAADNAFQLAIVHIIAGIMLFGYSVEYYKHMRKSSQSNVWRLAGSDMIHRAPQEQCPLNLVPTELGLDWDIVHLR